MSSSSSPCAACKLLRRKCTQGCVFAPYFPPDQPARFANVHKVFGASNVSKLLNELPVVQREDAVNSLAYEAEARLRDPVYGCVAYISVLQRRIKEVREDIANARKELAGYISQNAYGPMASAAGMHYPVIAAQYAAMGLHPPQQQQLAIQQPPHQYHQIHQQQIVNAQQMAAEVARGQHQHQDMMMRQGYVPHGAAGAPTVAVDPPGPGSADPAAYDGTPAPFLLQHQQQQPPSTFTYRMEPSPPPQSSEHSHIDMPQQSRQHTDGSDEGSGGAAPPA
ncbi:unnamed protein product [Alopecurus aequalis]